MAEPQSNRLDDIRRARIERQYRELRTAAPELFRECVYVADALVMNQFANLRELTDAQRVVLVSEIEAALVDMATMATRALKRSEAANG